MIARSRFPLLARRRGGHDGVSGRLSSPCCHSCCPGVRGTAGAVRLLGLAGDEMRREGETHVRLLRGAPLEDLLDHRVRIAGAELVLQRALRRRVKRALRSVPSHLTHQEQADPHRGRGRRLRDVVVVVVVRCFRERRSCRCQVKGQRSGLLVRHEDLEGTHDLCEWGALVLLPPLESTRVVDEDNEVILLALEVDLGLLTFSLGHDCVCLERSCCVCLMGGEW